MQLELSRTSTAVAFWGWGPTTDARIAAAEKVRAGVNHTLGLYGTWRQWSIVRWLGQDVLPGAMAAPSYVHFGHGADTPHEPALSEIYVRLLPSAQICKPPALPDWEPNTQMKTGTLDSVFERFVIHQKIP